MCAAAATAVMPAKFLLTAEAATTVDASVPAVCFASLLLLVLSSCGHL
jgi:hypothetical protein